MHALVQMIETLIELDAVLLCAPPLWADVYPLIRRCKFHQHEWTFRVRTAYPDPLPAHFAQQWDFEVSEGCWWLTRLFARAAMVLQRFSRGVRSRTRISSMVAYFLRKKAAARVLQSVVRVRQQQQWFSSCGIIAARWQQMWRGRRVRHRAQQHQSSALKMQTAIRQRKAYKEFSRQKAGAVRLQAAARGRTDRMTQLERQMSALLADQAHAVDEGGGDGSQPDKFIRCIALATRTRSSNLDFQRLVQTCQLVGAARKAAYDGNALILMSVLTDAAAADITDDAVGEMRRSVDYLQFTLLPRQFSEALGRGAVQLRAEGGIDMDNVSTQELRSLLRAYRALGIHPSGSFDVLLRSSQVLLKLRTTVSEGMPGSYVSVELQEIEDANHELAPAALDELAVIRLWCGGSSQR
jgi:hypothetical protein